MKLIIEHYGQAIITLWIFSGILSFFFYFSYGNKQGMESIIGNMVEETIHMDTLLTETGDTFFTYRNKPLPDILLKDAYALKAGQYIKVSDCFLATDYHGNTISVQVTNIYDNVKQAVSTVIKNGTEYFYFELSGIYDVYVNATDAENKTQIAYVKLFVQSE
ncbi:MAG: hypothetical protein IKJ01_02760 [Lachnospiraceae bacterium]|nr:hypothetical protein [Lachnospiraceae bacterium]